MKNGIKKMITFSLLMALTLVGCSGNTNTTSNKGESKQATSKVEDFDVANKGEVQIDLSKVEGAGDKFDEILKKGVITCATSPDFAPSEFVDLSSGETKYVGCDIDLAKYIAEKFGVDLEIKAMKFDAIKAAVTTGQVDMAISGFSYTEERAKNMELSELYGSTEADKGHGIVVRKEDLDKYKTKEDFDGKEILAQNGSIQITLTEEQLPKAICKPIVDINNGVMELIAGKADGLAIDLGIAEMIVSTHKDLAITNFKFDYEELGNVIACTKGETKLVSAINQVVKEVNEKGLYKKWKEDAIELAKSIGVEVNE